MAKQTINIGASPNDGTGTPLRTSFDYCNLNFTELYTALGGGVGLPGATTQVIFNDGGTNLAGDAGLVFDKTTDKLTIAGNVQAASATITGDLTVDTSTLKVDSANDRVGIGTASPAAGAKLGVLGATSVSTSDYIGSSTYAARFIGSSNGASSGISLLTNSAAGQPTPASIHATPIADFRSALTATYSADNTGAGYFAVNRFNPSGSNTLEHYKIDNAGVATWSNVGGVAGTAMTLNANGLGVGDSPSYKLHVAKTTDGTLGYFRRISGTINPALTVYCNETGNTVGFGTDYAGATSPSITFTTGGAERVRIDASGNLGIGVTPITSHILSCAGPVGISGTSGGTRTSYITNSISASIYYTDGGGSGYFTDFGNLIIQPRTSAARSVVIATGSTTPVERAVVKSTGQVRFVPLAADPAGAEAGDVYYNSVSNRLKYFNGTAWTLI